MKFLSLIGTCTLALLIASCNQRAVVGRGPTVNELMELQSTSFDKVAISAPVDIRISVGGAASVRFEGFANILAYLHTQVKNNTLRIYVEDDIDISTARKQVLYLKIPALKGLDISGSSDAVITGAVSAPDFNLDVSGSGSVDIQELHVRSFQADMSGSTSLNLESGDIENGSFDVAGSGEIKTFGVSQQITKLDLSGSTEAEVNVSDKLDVKISGSGSVLYKGRPAISQDISGSGSISAAR